MDRLDSDIVLRNLDDQLAAAEMGDNPCVIWLRPNGEVRIARPGFVANASKLHHRVDDDRIAFAVDMLRRVMREAWCDGVWLAVWGGWRLEPSPSGLLAPAPTEFMMMFKDGDGDEHVTVGCNDRWEVMQTFSADKMVSDCAEAIGRYRHLLARVDVRPEHMHSPAKGETRRP